MAVRALLLLLPGLWLLQHACAQPRLPDEWSKQLSDLNATREAQARPDIAFASFMAKYNKTWSDSEKPRRLNLFRQALDAIARSHVEFQAGNATYWLKVTPFADLTPAEFLQARVRGLQPSSTATEVTSTTRRELLQATSSPPSIDWRSAPFGSAVTPVEDQGQCNDCWAFATAAAVAASAAIRLQSPAVALSEQQVVNCALTGGGCTNGNTLPGGFSYYVGPGVTTAANFPYTSSTGLYTAGAGCSNVPMPRVRGRGQLGVQQGRTADGKSEGAGGMAGMVFQG